jgi:hypothetical protein
LAIGGARQLPELFEAAQILFDFGPETIGRLAGHVSDALDALPA